MLLKIVAVQARMGTALTLDEKIHIFKQQPDFICLPEYYLLDDSITSYGRAALRVREHLSYYRQLSYEFGACLVGGSVVEPDHGKLFNTVHVFDRGDELGKYRKRHPVERELQGGITPGDRHFVFDHEDARVGVLICGDVFYPDRFDELGEHQCDIIFIPTTSPFLPHDTIDAKMERDRKYFVEGAKRSGAYVVKVCGVGEIFGRPLQGRTLVAAPWGVEQRVDFSAEGDRRIVAATLDLYELREFRRKMRNRSGTTGGT